MQGAEAKLSDVAKAYEDDDEEAILAQLVNGSSFSDFLKTHNVKQVAEEWDWSTRKVGGPVVEETFPDKVVYTKHCRCVCEKNVKGHTAALGVLAMLKAAASRCKSPKEIPGADMLLIASAHNPSSSTPAVSYWWMLAASFQSGQHDATQTFWRCHHVHGSIGPLSPRHHLRIERNEFFAVESRARAPFDQQTAAPTFYDEEALARVLVCVDRYSKGDGVIATEFVLKKMMFIDQPSSPKGQPCVVVTGEDAAFEPLCLTKTLADFVKKPKKGGGGVKSKLTKPEQWRDPTSCASLKTQPQKSTGPKPERR